MSGKWNGSVCCYIDLAVGKKGLGPNWMGEVRHHLPFHIDYHNAACFHDTGYTLALIPRKQIDDKFLDIMLKEKDSMWAYVYYILVRIFGFIYYNGGYKWNKI